MTSRLVLVLCAGLGAGCASTATRPEIPATVALAVADDPVGSIPDDSPIADDLRRAEAAVRAVVAVPDGERTYENTLLAIDDLSAQLELDTNMTMFLAYVSPDAATRERGRVAEEHWTNWMIDLSTYEPLYQAVKDYADTEPELSGERARLLEHTLRDYRRAGMELDAERRGRLIEVQKEITRLSIEFEANIRDDETTVPLTPAELAGMPAEYLATLTIVEGMYLVGMSYPEFLPAMNLCPNETTRKKLWLAYKRRGGRANVQVLERLLELRAEAASLLGYPDPASYEIEVKMAKSPEQVEAFYARLRPLVRKKAALDWEEFLDAKRSETGDARATLYPWDFSYYQHVLKRDRYAVDSERVREYFPIERVIDGLFSITQSLYGLEYRDVTASRDGLWHEDVLVYEVWDRSEDRLLGEFMLDLHPRDNKYGHAAQWGLAQHKVWRDGRTTLPLAALVCNFTKPTADKPSLMSHDEVETFFHEFGHCLHTILSEAQLWSFAGTNVERDFVEAPSQMFENWVWDRDVLATFAAHYRTGEPLPDEVLDGMVRARHLGSGLAAERQFFYGMFDMACHTDRDGVVDTIALAHGLWDPDAENVELYDPVPETWFHAAFGHLTGYQAGYYGYQWSLVYASDMFQRFKELGMLDPEAGMYYRKQILARGGTLDGMDLVREYLGRDPDYEAYLKHLGLE